MTQSASAKYRTKNWKAYNAVLKQGGVLIWQDNDMAWQGESTGRRGRSPKFSDAAKPVMQQSPSQVIKLPSVSICSNFYVIFYDIKIFVPFLSSALNHHEHFM